MFAYLRRYNSIDVGPDVEEGEVDVGENRKLAFRNKTAILSPLHPRL